MGDFQESGLEASSFAFLSVEDTAVGPLSLEGLLGHGVMQKGLFHSIQRLPKELDSDLNGTVALSKRNQLALNSL